MLHVVEGLQYSLHQIVLCGNQLLEIDGVIGVWVTSNRLIRDGYKILRNPTYM
jgi:hypothetical protein